MVDNAPGDPGAVPAALDALELTVPVRSGGTARWSVLGAQHRLAHRGAGRG